VDHTRKIGCRLSEDQPERLLSRPKASLPLSQVQQTLSKPGLNQGKQQLVSWEDRAEQRG